MKNIYIITFLFLLSFTNLLAADFTVKKTRGLIYKINLKGEKTELKVGDLVKQKERVLTGPKSFILLVFDGEKITVGPKSDIKIGKRDKTGVLFIDFLKGHIRLSVSKSKKEKKETRSKLFVRSATASAAVRGTDFHMIYNEENKITNTVAYSGEVTFSRFKNPNDFNRFKEDPHYYNEENSVKLTQGNFSGSFPKKKTPTKPTKISPIQHYFLKGNDPFEQKRLKKDDREKIKEWDKVVLQNELKFEKEEIVSKNLSLRPLPRKFTGSNLDGPTLEKETDDKDILPGGYVDLDTGFYVSPPEGAEYDSKNKTYIPPKEYGGVNVKTGEYVPPLGLILHPLKGFVSLAQIVGKSAIKIGKKMASGVIYTSKMLKNGVLFTGKTIGTGLLYTGKTVGGILAFGGEKLKDGAVFGAKAITNGVITGGVVLKNGIFYTGSKITNGLIYGGKKITGTIWDGMELFATSAYVGAKLLAEQLNKQIYQNLLKRIHDLFKSNRYLSKLNMDIRADLYYDPEVFYPFYGEVLEVSDAPSVANSWDIHTSYKQYIIDGLFIDPFIDFNYVTHMRNDYFVVDRNDRKDVSFGSSLGIRREGFLNPFQIDLKFSRHNQWRWNPEADRNDKFTSDSLFSLSGIAKFFDFFAPEFKLHYGYYDAHGIKQGKIFKVEAAQIFLLPILNSIKFKYTYSKRDRKFDFLNTVWNEFRADHIVEDDRWGLELHTYFALRRFNNRNKQLSLSREKEWNFRAELGQKLNNGFTASTYFHYKRHKAREERPDFSQKIVGLALSFDFL